MWNGTMFVDLDWPLNASRRRACCQHQLSFLFLQRVVDIVQLQRVARAINNAL